MREGLRGGSGRLALAILLGVFAINFMDRQIVAILAEPIKRDLNLSDTEIGLLYGFAFAVLYTSAGIPIARLADRSNRARIIGWSLVLFSAMTLVCGLAMNYWQFLVGRVGVAIGEGGTNPPSHSIIADSFPFSRRTTAMAVFSLGPNIGILVGFLVAGWVAQLWGWRLAFVVAGVGGLAFALLCLRFLQEPSRDLARVAGRDPLSGRAVIGSLLGQASMRHLLAGASVFSVAVYALVGWLPSLLIRSHGFSTGAAGTILALLLGAVGGFGTLGAGLIADRLGSRDPAWRLQTVVLVLVAAAPLWAAVFLIRDSIAMVTLLVIPSGSILTLGARG
jgi:predicted MFS family arabinose efflux permease